MHRLLRLSLRDPKVGLAVHSKPGGAIELHQLLVAKWRQRAFIETLALGKIRYNQADMIKHNNLLWFVVCLVGWQRSPPISSLLIILTWCLSIARRPRAKVAPSRIG